ncbi:DUF3169 family protein [Streptococcus suis]|uniref:DUF3169 family protein n=1 Tax=Streptococcus suis TaxID=1307 RepID=A0A426G7U2_STRSU|nr:DUF3169 family protein [Streptococcus suis]MBY4974007.1 DUF3169 family protein [Streptococcus suis]QOZ89305.1 DUF3169 family protein [Streptococcus suis]RRN51074.1 DUF3169 family protein [Streptococcus suis]HEL2026975.1 DUF3169 family protein [Streptococcus suis]HEL2733741.1 DUF3169 family protein [Streptococcus suis]
MKQGKQLTTKQRWMRNLTYLFLGVIFGAFYGFFGVLISKFGLPPFVNLDNFLFCLRIVTFVIFAGTVYFGLKANQTHKRYHSISDEDEELIDDLYMKMYRNLEYATILFNIATSLTLLNLVLGFGVTFLEESAVMYGSIFDLVFYIVLLVSQVFIIKLTQKIREYKLSVFATVKEMKDFAEAMDEGEKQANYEMSFQIVFTLNQIVLPGLYLFLFVLSMLLQERQITAFLVVAFLHIYINVMQVRMVRRYFK